MEQDPMFKLEKTMTDAERAKSQKEALRELREDAREREDDYGINSMLRRKFRAEKKEIAKEEALARIPANFAMPLLPGTEEDALEVKKVVFRTDPDKVARTLKRTAAAAAPLFKPAAGKGLAGGAKDSSLVEILGGVLAVTWGWCPGGGGGPQRVYIQIVDPAQ